MTYLLLFIVGKQMKCPRLVTKQCGSIEDDLK